MPDTLPPGFLTTIQPRRPSRQVLDWDDLRYFLAVGRAGTLSAAARELKVDVGTVSRRVVAMERAIGTRCFERRTEGYPLTEGGRALLSHAQRIEHEVFSLHRTADAADTTVSGIVTIGGSDELGCAVVIPAMKELRARHPSLRIELVAEGVSATGPRREPDVVVTLALPAEGNLLSRRVGSMSFGLFASADYLARSGTLQRLEDLLSHDCIDWLDETPRCPTAAWFREVADGSSIALRANGSNERARAAALGLGIVALPHVVAAGARLVQILPLTSIPPSEIWLLAHPEAARIPRVRAVMTGVADYAIGLGRQAR